jgi:hypothetical protein
LLGKSQRTPALGPTCAADVAATPHSRGVSATKLPSHGSLRVFTVSCVKNALRGKAFEDEERPKVKPQVMNQANYRRCFHQRKCLGNNFIQGCVLVQKGSEHSEGNFSAVGSTSSFRILPEQAWWKNIWIFNPRDGWSVFTSLT